LLYTVILFVYGVTIWASVDPKMDTVSLSANAHEMPSGNIFENSYTANFVDDNSRAKIALSTEVNMMQYCIAPLVIPYLLGTSNAATDMSAKDKAVFDLSKAKSQPTTWDRRITASNYDKVTDVASPQFLLPWCRCAHDVLMLFKSNTKTTYATTNDAFKGCIATQYHVNRQKVANFNNPVDDNNIDSRKSLSRLTFVMFAVFAFAFNTFYSMLEFGPTEEYFSSRNIMYLVFLFLVIVAMFMMPLISMGGAPWQNIMAISSFVIVPSVIIEFLLTEMAWSAIYRYKRRTAYTHPFPFFITLFSLTVLALVENGVYSIEVIVTYFFVCHAVTFFYSAVLFFLHYHCADWTKKPGEGPYEVTNPSTGLINVDPSNIMAYFGICVVVAALMLLVAVPQFPTNDSLNVIWFTPLFYTLLTVGGAVWIEHLFDGKKDQDQDQATEHFKLELTSHLVTLAQAVLLLSLLFYFTGDYMIYIFGDKYLPNGGMVLNRPIYSFALTADKMRYVTP